jgi:hypothetical protein
MPLQEEGLGGGKVCSKRLECSASALGESMGEDFGKGEIGVIKTWLSTYFDRCAGKSHLQRAPAEKNAARVSVDPCKRNQTKPGAKTGRSWLPD